LRREIDLRREFDKRTYIEKYLPHVGLALQDILALSNQERDTTVGKLNDVLRTSRRARRKGL
jgi:DNA topoisomerase-6 subunit B